MIIAPATSVDRSAALIAAAAARMSFVVLAGAVATAAMSAVVIVWALLMHRRLRMALEDSERRAAARIKALEDRLALKDPDE